MPKEPSFHWRTFLPLFAIGGALATLFRHRSDIDPHSYLPGWIYGGLLVLGLTLIIIGFLASLTSIATNGAVHVWKRFSNHWFEPPRYECRYVRFNELEQLQTYWQRFFEADMSDLAQSQEWHKKTTSSHCFCLKSEIVQENGTPNLGWWDRTPSFR